MVDRWMRTDSSRCHPIQLGSQLEESFLTHLSTIRFSLNANLYLLLPTLASQCTCIITKTWEWCVIAWRSRWIVFVWAYCLSKGRISSQKQFIWSLHKGITWTGSCFYVILLLFGHINVLYTRLKNLLRKQQYHNWT